MAKPNNLLSDEELGQALQSAKWKHSTRGNDHEYVLELKYPELVRTVQAKLKAEGVRERHRHYWQRYWHHGKYKYWVMLGLPIPTLPRTLVLNRTEINKTTL